MKNTMIAINEEQQKQASEDNGETEKIEKEKELWQPQAT